MSQRIAPERFDLAGHFSHSHIVQSRAPVHLGPHHMPFFYPKRAESFKPVWPQIPWRSLFQQMLPDTVAVMGRRIDFVGEFTRKCQPDDADGHAGQQTRQRDVQHAHMRYCVVVEVHARKCRPQDFAGLGSGHAHGSPLVGHRNHRDAQFRPNDLQQKLEVAHDLASLRRSSGHEEFSVPDTAGGAVIHHDTVLAQHEPVACLADRQLGKTVDVHAIQKLCCVRPLYVDLAQRGHVGYSNLFPHYCHLDLIGVRQSRGTAVKPQGAHPQARLHHRAAVGKVPVVHGCAPHRLQMCTYTPTRQRADGGRCVRRAERGGSHVLNAQPAPGSHYGQPVQV